MIAPFLSYRPAVTLFAAVLFASLSLVSYWPSFFGERIWDDHFLTLGNPFLRSPYLALEAFRHWMYPFSTSTYYRPVQNVSYIWDYWIWGEKLFGYHLTNVLLHAGAALLLKSLVCRVGLALTVRESNDPQDESRITALSWIAAILWLVHPIHHAGVAYVSGRADSLAALLALGAWWTIDRGLIAQRVLSRAALFAAAAALGMAALCSKEIAVTWFVLFSIYHLFFSPRLGRGTRLALVGSCCAVVATYWLIRSSISNSGGGAATELALAGLPARLLLVLQALADYVSIVVLPINLHMERSFGGAIAGSEVAGWLDFHRAILLPLGIVALVAGAFAWFRAGRCQRLRQFAICWFLVGFLPISNLIPLNAHVAEHWIYMPSGGLILLLAIGGMSTGLPRRMVLGCFAALAAVLVCLTHSQSRTWVDEEAFFRTTIARGGGSPRIRANLAQVLTRKGDLPQAEAIVREALRKDPDLPMLRVQLAEILRRRGMHDEAAEIVAIDLKREDIVRQEGPIPWARDVYFVEALLSGGREKEAREALREALERHPGAWPLVRLQAMLYQKDGEAEHMFRMVADYVQKMWWHREAVIFLAQHLAAAGRFDEAIVKYELAAKLDIRSSKPYEQIAALQFRQSRFGEALEAQRLAVRRQPGSGVQRMKLAEAYEAAGQTAEAAAERNRAAALLAEPN